MPAPHAFFEITANVNVLFRSTTPAQRLHRSHLRTNEAADSTKSILHALSAFDLDAANCAAQSHIHTHTPRA